MLYMDLLMNMLYMVLLMNMLYMVLLMNMLYMNLLMDMFLMMLWYQHMTHWCQLRTALSGSIYHLEKLDMEKCAAKCMRFNQALLIPSRRHSL